MLDRTLRVEAFKDRFEILLGNARPLVVDCDHERTAARLAAQLNHDPRTGRAERQRIVDDVAEHLAVTAVVAVCGERRVGGDAEIEVDAGLTCRADGIVANHVGQEAMEVDGFYLAAHQFGVESGGVGNVGNQPIQPVDVVHDDGHELGAAFRVEVLARRHFDGGTQGSERILEFVRHIGGEAFDGVDALPQRVGHRAQGVVQIADLVAALAEIRNLRPAFAGETHFVGGARQPHDGLGDGAGKVEREQHRDAESRRGDGQHVVADLPQRGGDGAIVPGEDQCPKDLLVALDRHCSAQDKAAVAGDPHGRGIEAAQRARRLGVIADCRRGALHIFGEAVSPRQLPGDPVADLVAQGNRCNGGTLGWRQRAAVDAAELAQKIRVAQQVAGLAEQAGSHTGRAHQTGQELTRGIGVHPVDRGLAAHHGNLADACRHHLALDQQRCEFGVDQLVFVVAEIDCTQRQQGHRYDVEQQDAARERRIPALAATPAPQQRRRFGRGRRGTRTPAGRHQPAECRRQTRTERLWRSLAPARFRRRGIGIQCHRAFRSARTRRRLRGTCGGRA